MKRRTVAYDGKLPSSTGGMKRPRTLRQNALATKISRHQSRQRSSVRRPTPKIPRNRVARRPVTPWVIAVTSTTTAPR
jgi:hypothetical protein